MSKKIDLGSGDDLHHASNFLWLLMKLKIQGASDFFWDMDHIRDTGEVT